MRRVAFTSILLASFLSGPPVSDGEPPPGDARKKEPPVNQTKVQQMMQRKRHLSHEVFDAIVAKDFKGIGRDAKELVDISRAAEWRVFQTPRYLQYSAEFQDSAEKLADTARDRNSDGTTLAFTQLMFSCVRCHDYIRQTRSTRLDPGPTERLPDRAALPARVPAGDPADRTGVCAAKRDVNPRQVSGDN